MSAPTPAAPRRASPLRALRHPNYRLFFAGQLVSLIGTWVQTIALSWLTYRLTGSAALLGLVGFATQIPVFLLSSVGGAVADATDRHRIMVAAQVASMLLAAGLAVLTLEGSVHVWHVFTVAALLGTVNAFDIPARQAFVVEMVGRDDLPNAIALNSSMFNGARLVGPAVAGALLPLVGEGWCFAINAASYLAVIAALLAMRRQPVERPRPTGGLLSRMREGFSYVHRTRPVRGLLLLVGVASLMGSPYIVLMPIFADQVFGGDASTLGLLMSAIGVGALAGALLLAMRQQVRGLGRWIAAAAVGYGLMLMAFAQAPSLAVALPLLAVTGFCMMIQNAASNTLIQAMVPDAYRGRVMAVYSMMFMGMMPFGALIGGVLAQHLGAPQTVTLGGAACLVAAAVFALRLGSLRAEGRRLLLDQSVAVSDPAAARLYEPGTGGAPLASAPRRPEA